MAKNAQTVTIYGRLSYPTFTTEQAYELAQKGQFPTKSPADSTPSFQLLVEKPQLEKLISHARDVFLPWAVERGNAGEKKNSLSQADVKKLLAQVDDVSQWGDAAIYNTPFKPVSDNTVEHAPEAVASISVRGSKGQDIELRAIVNSVDEQATKLDIATGEEGPVEPDILTYPLVMDLAKTKHSIYAGAHVAATLNLYCYYNGKLPGFSASAGVAVFKADGERIGGGVAVDENEIFLD